VEFALLGCFRSFPFASTPLRLEPPSELNALKMLNFGIIKGASWEGAYKVEQHVFNYARHEEAMLLCPKRILHKLTCGTTRTIPELIELKWNIFLSDLLTRLLSRVPLRVYYAKPIARLSLHCNCLT